MKTITQYSNLLQFNMNYLLIIQTKTTKFDHKNAVEYRPDTQSIRILEDHEIEEIKDNSEEAEENLLNYLKNNAMHPDNTGYDYFRIIFADGQEIICNSFENFMDYYTD